MSHEGNACSVSVNLAQACLCITCVCVGSCLRSQLNNAEDANMEKVLLSCAITSKVLVKWGGTYWLGLLLNLHSHQYFLYVVGNWIYLNKAWNLLAIFILLYFLLVSLIIVDATVGMKSDFPKFGTSGRSHNLAKKKVNLHSFVNRKMIAKLKLLVITQSSGMSWYIIISCSDLDTNNNTKQHR